MESQDHAQDAPCHGTRRPRHAEHVAYIGTRNAAGLFYAACSRDQLQEALPVLVKLLRE